MKIGIRAWYDIVSKAGRIVSKLARMDRLDMRNKKKGG